MKKIVVLFVFFLFPLLCLAENTVPELDGKDVRTGVWYLVAPKGAVDSDGSRWEGYFKKGKENKVMVYFFGGGLSVDEYTAARGNSVKGVDFNFFVDRYDPFDPGIYNSGIYEVSDRNHFKDWTILGLEDGKESLSKKISRTHRITSEDRWHGYHRVKFDFEGFTAWVVEPDVKAAEGRPWTWTMQWADAFVERTGVPELLAKGYHHATVEAYDTRACDEALPMFARYQKFLVDTLGFAPKANLIGMSWGGFFSTRYAAAYPENVRKIYLDAPLLNFDGFDEGDFGPWKKPGCVWTDDPRMPVNLAAGLARTGIPVLLLYGGQDRTLDPKINSELFISRFKDAGGDINVILREGFGHHPHGVDPGDSAIVDFFDN